MEKEVKENKQNVKSNKKIIIICFAIVVVIFLLLFFIINNNFKNFNKNIENNNDINIEEDKEAPNLVLKDIIIKYGDEYSIDKFVKKCTDNVDSECELSYIDDEMGTYEELGIYDISIVASDSNGNETVKKCVLKIVSEDSEELKDIENNEDENLEIEENDTKDDYKENVAQDSNNQTTTRYSNNNTTTKKTTTTVKKDTNTKTTTKASTTKKNTTTKATTKQNTTVQTTTKQTTTQKTTQKTTTTTQKYKVDSKTETSETVTYQYGTTIKKITYIYYDIYSDGSKIQTGSNDEYQYDYSTFNATTNDLRSEATSLVNQNSGVVNEVLNYTNQYRSEVGASPLSLDYSLNVAASIRALEMGWSNTFSHTRPNGTMWYTVLGDLGIGYYEAGENIAMNYWNAVSVSNGWKNSEGHYNNMIKSSFGKIGIGMAKVNGNIYWVQLFTN